MEEKDIRPLKFQKKYEQLMKDDFLHFFKDRNIFKSVNCPACHSKKYSHEFNKGGFKYCRCQKCQTLFTNPRPIPKQLADFYTSSGAYSFWSMNIFPSTEKTRMKNIFIPRAKLIRSLLKKYFHLPMANLLDIGAGYGTFLQAAKDLGLAREFVAVEPVQNSADKCRTRGFSVIQDMVENIKTGVKEKFDLAVNFELIEHLFNPGLFIKSCCSMLKKGGIFVVTTPNIDGFDLEILGLLSDNIGGLHLNYFNPESLGILLEKGGFENLEILTPGELDVDIVRNKILEGKLSIKKLPFLGEAIINNNYNFNKNLQKFLRDNKLSSNMMVLARKK